MKYFNRMIMMYLILLLSVNQLNHPRGGIVANNANTCDVKGNIDGRTLPCQSSSSSSSSSSSPPSSTTISEKIIEIRVLLDAYIVRNGGSSGSSISNELIRIKKSSVSKLIKNELEWLREASSFDIERFLNYNDGNVIKAYESLINHANWRTKNHAANDVLSRSVDFEKSNLNQEIFWIGETKNNCPTLVIRSNYHDGADYEEDPVKFTDFVIYQLEKGRQMYGFGEKKRMCLILDRVTKEGMNGSNDSFDMRVIPNLVALFRHLYAELTVNYPDVLDTVIIAPSTWFSSTCYSIISKVLDKGIRDVVEPIPADKVQNRMLQMFSEDFLPPHLGGTSPTYGGSCIKCVIPESTTTDSDNIEIKNNANNGNNRGNLERRFTSFFTNTFGFSNTNSLKNHVNHDSHGNIHTINKQEIYLSMDI